MSNAYTPRNSGDHSSAGTDRHEVVGTSRRRRFREPHILRPFPVGRSVQQLVIVGEIDVAIEDEGSEVRVILNRVTVDDAPVGAGKKGHTDEVGCEQTAANHRDGHSRSLIEQSRAGHSWQHVAGYSAFQSSSSAYRSDLFSTSASGVAQMLGRKPRANATFSAANAIGPPCS